jgi:hypothetical protein
MAIGHVLISDFLLLAQPMHDLVDFLLDRRNPLRRIDYKIRSSSFLLVRQLPGKDRGEFCWGHPWTGKNTLSLDIRGSGYNNNGVQFTISPSFKKEGDIEKNKLFAIVARPRQELTPVRGHKRMNDGLEARHLLRLMQHLHGQSRAINAPIHYDSGKRLINQWDGCARVKRVDSMIGIMDTHAFPPEHFRGRGFAHPD